jgi:RNA polymerase sigma-70 factor (ECF subfamily)
MGAPRDRLPDDVASFCAVVQHQQGRVRAFLRRLTRGDHALADDLAQETFLQAWRKRDRFRGEGSIEGWLTRIAWTRYLMYRRAEGRQPEELDDQLPDMNAASPGNAFDLERAMARLSAHERAALTLCYALEYSHAEAAAIMALPLGTVKSHVQRGRGKLRALLEQADD